jgi:osmotically-inducible protein OsmY
MDPTGNGEEDTMDDLLYGAARLSSTDDFLDDPLPETLAEAERLAASIERAVWEETGGGVRDLRVEVSRQGVLLTGRCETYYTKQKAQHAAMAVPGGGQLTNRIQVT